MRLKVGIFAYEFEDGLNDESPDLASTGIFAYECELPDLDATAELDDLPDLAVQPGGVDPAGLDDTTGCANIPDDDGVPRAAGYLSKAGAAIIPEVILQRLRVRCWLRSSHTRAVCCDELDSSFKCSVGLVREPGSYHHFACCEGSCKSFKCDAGYTLRAEATSTPRHIRAACCDELCGSSELRCGAESKVDAATIPDFKCGGGFVGKTRPPPFKPTPAPR